MPPRTPPKRGVNIRLRPDQEKAIEEMIERSGDPDLTRSVIVRRAIDEFIGPPAAGAAKHHRRLHTNATPDEMRTMEAGQQIQKGRVIRPAREEVPPNPPSSESERAV